MPSELSGHAFSNPPGKTVPGSEHLGCKAFGSAGQKLGGNTEAFGVLMDFCFIMQRVAKCASWVIAAVLSTNSSVCIGRGLQRLGTCGHRSAICFLTCYLPALW